MGKTVVLAEKPSVGRELAAVLGCKKKEKSAFISDKYIVTWALGHLVTLEDPVHYNPDYKTWSMETLPMLPEKMALKVIPQTKGQFAAVKAYLRSSEVTDVIIATDAGREGELVARWILEKAGCKKPIRRLWISSQTKKAIEEGFLNLAPGEDYDSLYAAAQARAEADWLVGLNTTRALTCKFGAQLSAGRVQTPTLALIAAREKEIREFRPRDYYTLRADLGNFFVSYRDKDGQASIFEKEKAEALAKKIQGATFTITDLKTTKKNVPPPLLYDLTELQRDANKAYGFSPKETLRLMQSLYEHHKALTYPRTDSRYLTEDIVPTLPERLRALDVPSLRPFVSEIRKNGYTIHKACINNDKVSDHHAIIPTEEYIDISALSADEAKIYMLVVKRFVACFFPAYTYLSVKTEAECEGEHFVATGREVTEMGWRGVQNLAEEEEESEQNLPKIEKGATFVCRTYQLKAQKTTPPERYTEATLLSAMENPAKFIENKSMRAFVGNGLGTPATRADIIEKLYTTFYMEKPDGKHIVPTAKGMQLIDIVPADLKEPLLTAEWEQKLEDIRSGKLKKKAFIGDIRTYAASLVGAVKDSEAVYRHENLTQKRCPDCGERMLEVQGKKGKMLVCSDPECGHRENLSMQSGARCPQCSKKLEIFGAGEKKLYVCRCGFREKAETFEKRLAENRASRVSRKDVQKYMQKQNNDTTTMADLLRQAMEGK
ncbi:MAG: DNA topoisomerase III [Ruminococcaceae bacterium]|nr:DNA topoisomerase III [Oscillospiraceae bacterium]